jgi:hypothetical protein
MPICGISVFDVRAFPRSFTTKELPGAVHGFGFLAMASLLVAVLVLIVQTNCLLFTYLGQWMMKVLEQSLVNVERIWMLR